MPTRIPFNSAQARDEIVAILARAIVRLQHRAFHKEPTAPGIEQMPLDSRAEIPLSVVSPTQRLARRDAGKRPCPKH